MLIFCIIFKYFILHKLLYDFLYSEFMQTTSINISNML